MSDKSKKSISELKISTEYLSMLLVKNDQKWAGIHKKNLLKIDQRYPGWVCEGREIFDQDEDGKIADHEVR